MSEQRRSGLAATARAMFEKELDRAELRYRSDAEKNAVRIKYSGSHFEAVTFTFLFDADGRSASLTAYSIAEIPKELLQEALELCNRVNQTYRWLRFFVDEDLELTATADLAFTPVSAGEICMDQLRQSVSTLNAVCKELN